MLKRTVLFFLSLFMAAFLPGCGSKDNNNDVMLLLLLANSCRLSGTITDLSGLAADGDTLSFYIDNDVNYGNGTVAAYTLTWNGGTGVGNPMNYSLRIDNVTAGAYYLMVYEVSKPPVYGYSNNPATSPYGNPVTVNVDCGTTWNLSMDIT